jgi:hypothetical protein
VIVSASGGARMQEGTLSLMQLAKTVAAIERLRTAGVPFISILTDPTTGGVFASFAVLGDVNVAEPNALIGFAGARVSAGTIAQELPEGFQRSEFLYAHGFLDRVVHRTELRAEVAGLLAFLVARRLSDGGDEIAGDVLALPSFRPLTFLSNLAERVMQTDPEPAVPTGGNGTRPASTSAVPVRASAPTTTEPETEAEAISAPEPPDLPPAEPEPATATESPAPALDEEAAAATEEARRG